MSSNKTIEAEIAAFMATFLRTHFGKGPTSVYVTLKSPFITIHFRGLHSPMEKLLFKQGEWKRVLQTRDMIANELKEELILELRKLVGLNVHSFFADWNLEKESGMFIGVLEIPVQEQDFQWPANIDRDELEHKVEISSEAAQKKPGIIKSYWLSDRTLLIERREILVGIEKALISNGYTEALKLTKRPLERSLLWKSGLRNVLPGEIQELFLDWDFEEDISYIVIVMKSN